MLRRFYGGIISYVPQLCMCPASRLPHLETTRPYADLAKEIEELMVQQIPDQEIPAPADSTVHELLNVTAYGHDCTLVEHYAQYAHNLAKTMSLKVFESYALQTKTTLVHAIQHQNTPERMKIKDFKIPTHRRVVQIQDLSSRKAGLFLELLQLNLPQGVSVSIEPHTQEHYKDRFIQKEVPKSLI